MIPLILEAFLAYNLIGYSIVVLYPSAGTVQQVCIGDYQCYAPTNGVADIFPLEDDFMGMVQAELKLPDGKVRWVYAYPLPPYEG